jgi:hypothetical protein
VTFRVTDIMRGYWAQRILWDIGGALSFRRPSVDQIRNVHDYLEDFESELQLYSEAGKLTHFLQHWTSPATSLRDRIYDLFSAMEAHEFIAAGDRELVALWLGDLERIGYVFPEVTPWVRETAVEEAREAAVRGSTPDFAAQVDWLGFKCQGKGKPVFNETLLVVVFNSPFYQLIPTFEDVYKQFFPHIVYYGPIRPGEEDPRVTQIDIGVGEIGYRAFMHAIDQNPGYSGYLWTNDVRPLPRLYRQGFITNTGRGDEPLRPGDAADRRFLAVQVLPPGLWRLPTRSAVRRGLPLVGVRPQGHRRRLGSRIRPAAARISDARRGGEPVPD